MDSHQPLRILLLPPELLNLLRTRLVTLNKLTVDHNAAHVMMMTIAVIAHAPEEVVVAVAGEAAVVAAVAAMEVLLLLLLELLDLLPMLLHLLLKTSATN